MDNKEKLSVSLRYDEAQTIPLAVHEMHMARKDRNIKHIIIGWAVSLVAVVALFVFLWLQYDYESTTTTTTEYSGVYNITDSEGNVISADLTPEDVIRIMESLNGKGEEDSN